MASIRAYRPTDRAAVAQICLRTGNAGRDATGIYSSDELLADIFVLPYVDLEPDLAWVVDVDGRAQGYLVGTADTRAFVQRYRAQWLPHFAGKYRLEDATGEPDVGMIKVGLHPERMLNDLVEAYPAHLHIDLLPALQGQGFGRRLIRILLDELATRGVAGVQLGVSPENTSAQAFYERLAFVSLPDGADFPRYGIATRTAR